MATVYFAKQLTPCFIFILDNRTQSMNEYILIYVWFYFRIWKNSCLPLKGQRREAIFVNPGIIKLNEIKTKTLILLKWAIVCIESTLQSDATITNKEVLKRF